MKLSDIQNKGLVGAGGAGFPTHVKLDSRPEFLIVNAAECEPLLHKDKELLLHFTRNVLSGLETAMELTGASHGIIGIKEKHKQLIAHLETAVSDQIRIEPIGDFYPAGDEVTLVYLTTGRVIQPGQLPITQGCVVQNVETLFNLAAGSPVTEKWLTVGGAVSAPKTLCVPIGVTFAEVLSHFDITVPNYALRSGGLMMGILETDLNQVVTKTTGGLIVLPADHACVTLYRRFLEDHDSVRIAKAGCDQCSFCTELCPRYLLGHPVRPETAMRNRMFSREEAPYLHPGNQFCCECNLCTVYSCPESLDPKGCTMMEKRIAHSENIEWEGLPVKAHPMMEYRKVPTDSLKQRLDVKQFQDSGPFESIDWQAARVRIPLRQHIGAPALPVVQKGEVVHKNDCLAEADGRISCPVHASINGRVVDVSAKDIILERL